MSKPATKPSAPDAEEAETLLKVRAAKAARREAAKAVEAEKAALAELIARRVSLPLDNAVIEKHRSDEIAEAALQRAVAALMDLEAEADAADRKAAYGRTDEARQDLLKRADVEFSEPLKNVRRFLLAMVDLEKECARVNRRLPEGASPLSSGFVFSGEIGPLEAIRFEVSLVDAKGGVLWRGDGSLETPMAA